MSVFQNLILSTVLDLVLFLQIKKQTCLVLKGKKQSHREEEEFWSLGVILDLVMDSNIRLVLVVES